MFVKPERAVLIRRGGDGPPSLIAIVVWNAIGLRCPKPKGSLGRSGVSRIEKRRHYHQRDEMNKFGFQKGRHYRSGLFCFRFNVGHTIDVFPVEVRKHSEKVALCGLHFRPRPTRCLSHPANHDS